MKDNMVKRLLDRLLNIGTRGIEDVNKIRLIRQVNGLNAFFTVVASSLVVILLVFVPQLTYMILVQAVASVLYFSNIILNRFGKYKPASLLTIYTFEWHLFLAIVLTNMYQGVSIYIVVIYPLLAALVEVSVIRHMSVSLFQVAVLVAVNYFFPSVQNAILKNSQMDSSANEVMKLLSVIYIPVMGAVIMRIIFSENLRAREIQKKMLAEISAANKQLEYYAAQLEDEATRLRAEVEVAKKLQTMVLPSAGDLAEAADLDIACIMRPADEVGGDYYDVISLNGRVVIGIGDVTGHGLPSGIIMMMAQTAIRTIVEFDLKEPSDLLRVLNRVLFSNINRIREDRNMTLSIMYYSGGGRFMVSGQHESVIICRKSGAIENLDTIGLGYYIGMLPEVGDNVKNREISLEPGETMVLYSDGITEAENTKKEQFGLKRLEDHVLKYRGLDSEALKNRLIRDIYNFIGNSEVYDDITLLVIKRK